MKTKPSSLLPALLVSIFLVLTLQVDAQTTQTIRGRIFDEISKAPIPGATVMVISLTPNSPGSTTDENGEYRIEKIPVGRQTIKITYLGYEEQTIPNVVVTAGKEVILNIQMSEKVSQLDEVVIIADTQGDKTATNNDLAVVSARSFNVDDTKRYAGALGDPSRMAANFAGVIGGNDSRNDIVVRGNSPTGMLWQMEGLNIPNPNHFGALVATGGPVNMLNNNNLDKSDFMTSAFPAQYGNATAGVFDIRLRDGNNEKREFLGQIGFNGLELGAEGPFSKKSNSSFIVNYRYSTLAVFKILGLQFGTGANVPYYQDINFKSNFSLGKNTRLIVFGMGGNSKIDLLGSEADLENNSDLYGSENYDAYPKYQTGIVGVSLEKTISEKTFLKLTTGISHTQESFHSDSLVRNAENEVIAEYLSTEAAFTTLKYSLNLYERTKFNSKNSLTTGFYIDAMNFDLFSRDVYANVNREEVRLDVEDKATLGQFYATWRHRFNNKLSLNTGAHAQYYSLNEQFVVEPRISAQYLISANHSISAGYGIHNQVQNITTSFVQTKTASGETVLTNRGLGYTRSQHYVLTYDWNISANTRLKSEVYYQMLDAVPVERRPTSFSALNTAAAFGPLNTDSLVNNGPGRNYGIEFTLERFYNKGYYYLLTTSLFDSRYKGSDGVQRNTAFNTQYVVNALAGKEWKLGKNNKFLSFNLKGTTIGGKYLTPIDFEKSQQYGYTVYDENKAFSEKQQAYFRMDAKISFRQEYRKSSMEISIDFQNLTNNKNIFSQTYNPRTNSVVTQYQTPFFPVPYTKFTF